MDAFTYGISPTEQPLAAQPGALVPTIHVISDSLGETAAEVALAATAQFGAGNVHIQRLPKVSALSQVKAYLDEHCSNPGHRSLVFYTIVDPGLRAQIQAEFEARGIDSLDLIGPAIDAVQRLTGLEPHMQAGAIRKVDDRYFNRINAMEFFVAHDDGRNPQEMNQADIVLLGVSRSSKTPTSIYLAQQGYKVSNIPLDPSTEPPKEVYDVDRTRLFGLMTTPDVLIGIRQRRLGNAAVVASKYADPEYVYEDLDKARALMRKLGAIVIHTENRAVEETAQEILRYYERVHPMGADIVK